MSQIVKLISLASKLTIAFSFIFLLVYTTAADVNVPTDAPTWGTPPGIQISASTFDTESPNITYSASGNRLMIGFVQRLGNDKTSPSVPQYALSTNDGDTWTNPTNVSTNTSDVASELKVAFTGETAHAIWVETNFDTGQDRLLTAPESTWPAASPRVLDTSDHIDSFILTPDVATNGNQIHVVWSQGLPANIHHTWSNDGGNSWFDSPPIETQRDSVEASVSIASSGRIHIVWQEFLNNTSKDTVYIEGAVSGTTVIWSSSLTLVTAENSTPPNINAIGNKVRVNYGRITESEGQELQDVRYRDCSANCTTDTSWNDQGSISGAVVGVNNEPSDLISAMVHDTAINTTFVYFHGFTTTNNEIILGVNDCDGWVSSGRDEVTLVNNRSIRPDIAIHAGELQLVYQFEESNGNTSIYTMSGNVSCSNRAYMPVIYKN